MSLPILQVQQPQATEADLVRLFHRTDALWVQHLAEAEQLPVGTAYLNPSLPNVWDANHVRDAALSDGLTARQAYDDVTAHYAARGVRCAFWVMNPSAPSAQTQPLIDHLLAAGHGVHREAIFYLRHQPRRELAVGEFAHHRVEEERHIVVDDVENRDGPVRVLELQRGAGNFRAAGRPRGQKIESPLGQCGEVGRASHDVFRHDLIEDLGDETLRDVAAPLFERGLGLCDGGAG